MNPKQRTTAFLLLLATALLTASCGDSGDTAQPKETQKQNETATSVETEAPRVKANLPEKDFNGETFTFYGRIYGGIWSADDILSHKEDGEQINDALYERTCYIEDTYNVKLDLIESGTGTITDYAKTYITAGDTSFQAIVSKVYDAGALSLEGMLVDLNTLEHLDFSQPWWAQKTNASLSIANRLYYATGDISIIDNKATRVFFFNKNIIRDLDLPDPYTLVDQNEWVIEKYLELSDAVLYDLNGDGTYARETDRFGTMAQPSIGSVLYFASGNLFTEKDKNDMPQIICGEAKALSVMSSISSMIAGKQSISTSYATDVSGGAYPDNIAYFMDGRVLFAPDVLAHIETMRNCPIDIGLLPPPKYEASQDSYYCYADGWCVNVVSIPVTNTQANDAAFLLEAMAADSLNNLTPAYFDVVLTDKYARDEQSVRMLDLILNSTVMDNANVFAWGSIENTVDEAMSKGNAIASTIERKLSKMEKDMNTTITSILGAES